MLRKFMQKLNLQLFAEQPTGQPPQAQPTGQVPVQQPQIDINSLVNNLSARIDQTLNQRLAPIEQRMNQPTHNKSKNKTSR